MWKPESYRDADYGLADDEIFEPADIDDDVQEPALDAPHLQTVLGRTSPDEAGMCLVREHLFTDALHHDPDRRLTDSGAALVDLETFFTVGGRTVVDATVPVQGRSAKALVWLAQRAPVHIVASSGFVVGAGEISAQVRAFERDMREGLDGTQVKPGILSASVDVHAASKLVRRIMPILTSSIQQFDLPVMIHVASRSVLKETLSNLTDSGVPAQRIIAGNVPNSNDLEAIQEFAEMGSFVLVDGLGKREPAADKRIALSTAELIQAGLGSRILLSHGFDRRSQLTGYQGRPGLGYIVEQFAIMLLEAGVTAQEVRMMLVDNSAEALTVHPSIPMPN